LEFTRPFSNQSANLAGEIKQRGDRFRGTISQAISNHQLSFQFTQRSVGNAAKTDKLAIAGAALSLRDIRRHRDRRTPHLTR
jgi:hypothetical protein